MATKRINIPSAKTPVIDPNTNLMNRAWFLFFEELAAFSPVNLLEDKGDIITHDGNTPVKLAVGADTTTLTADSAGDEGIKWV